ncbi:siah interacting protein, amine-terminal protein (macronuclear) [Tetrahymena thermophila SB210]|uniref:Siah interacting protein, amine-terminal protein n=1 Tax=Tetrahymena thermophila (strain SB210) TaxID=312017 RepID=Q23FH5_TETTS|nr:siah interacting protein, amine-terminal protein [Tetrahymena thermophila SB210]EAR95178.2 siah interacting protein, amine-terminal protein [Tetrahymena thermophila SB210]|eukprot:XP_001015423.2 siah interacting protein, amine-terminal protein [Tetrahymena thermophila SB210]
MQFVIKNKLFQMISIKYIDYQIFRISFTFQYSRNKNIFKFVIQKQILINLRIIYAYNITIKKMELKESQIDLKELNSFLNQFRKIVVQELLKEQIRHIGVEIEQNFKAQKMIK